jgi:hypothetical protein
VLHPLAEKRGLDTWEKIVAFAGDEWFPSRLSFGKFKSRIYQGNWGQGELGSGGTGVRGNWGQGTGVRVQIWNWGQGANLDKIHRI